MLNNSPWLRDRALQDISDTEANLIAGGQVTSVPELRDVLPAITEPKKKRVMSSKISKSTGLAALSGRVMALVQLFANPFA